MGGAEVPQKNAGVTAMREAFHTAAFNAGALNACNCMAQRDDAFEAWARTLLG
jgi:hypothetical protein